MLLLNSLTVSPVTKGSVGFSELIFCVLVCPLHDVKSVRILMNMIMFNFIVRLFQVCCVVIELPITFRLSEFVVSPKSGDFKVRTFIIYSFKKYIQLLNVCRVYTDFYLMRNYQRFENLHFGNRASNILCDNQIQFLSQN